MHILQNTHFEHVLASGIRSGSTNGRREARAESEPVSLVVRPVRKLDGQM